MAWVVDTSVLLDIHLDDPTFGKRSGQCLMGHLLDGLVICPVSYIELAPAFSGDNSLQQAFLQEAGVDWLQPWTLLDTTASYQLWATHIAKKRAGHKAASCSGSRSAAKTASIIRKPPSPEYRSAHCSIVHPFRLLRGKEKLARRARWTRSS